MSVRWRIELLGAFRVVRDGRDDFRFATRKTAALLAYLAYHANKAFPREMLADHFWPDHEAESARNSLRVALNALRKMFEVADGANHEGGDLLVTDRSSVRLNSAVFITDVAELESLLRTERDLKDPVQQRELLLQIAALYQGPLLAGWYEEWIGGEQTRLAEAYASALRRLTGLLIESQEFDRALDFARRAAEADPLREETHRLLIRLHAMTGSTTRALSQYRALESRLQEDLGTTPSRVTRELMRQILSADKSEQASEKATAPLVQRPDSIPDKTVSPAPVPKTSIPNPLPRPMTRFFGRDLEIDALLKMLSPEREDCCRLVTLTGMGGTGKTRLALEIAARFADATQVSSALPAPVFSGGVWVVPLAEVSSPALLEAAVAAALVPSPPRGALAASEGNGLAEQIRQSLRGPVDEPPRPTLLVLDNFEQLVDGGAKWLTKLMDTFPFLACLVTSRQRLDIAGEQEMPVTPLPIPVIGTERTRSDTAVADFPSVRLFVDRARAVRPDFGLHERNSASVAELCARLDGLPLAIELAAAWARLLTPAQMLMRLNARFDLLIAAQRDIAPRHRSLRAVLDETCRLMPDDLRRVFSGLSVFHGGWTLQAAEAILMARGDRFEMLEMIALLQQRSLIVVVEAGEEVRFRMLETVREYAATLLDPRETLRLQAIHAAYYADFARSAAPHLNRVESTAWLARLDDEQDNLRAALALVPPASNTELPPMASVLWRYWYARGRAEEGLCALQKELSRNVEQNPRSEADRNRARLCEGAGRLALALGQGNRACQFLQDGLRALNAEAELPGADNEPLLGPLAANLALAGQAASDERIVCPAYQQVLKQKRMQGDLWAAACTLVELGESLLRLSKPEDAAAAFLEGSALNQLMGDRERADECRAALALIQNGKNAVQAILPGSAGAVAHLYLRLGHVALEQEDFTVALTLLEEARTGFLASGSQEGVTLTCERIGLAAVQAGDAPRARNILEEALARREAEPEFDDEVLRGYRRQHHAWLLALLRRAQSAPDGV